MVPAAAGLGGAAAAVPTDPESGLSAWWTFAEKISNREPGKAQAVFSYKDHSGNGRTAHTDKTCLDGCVVGKPHPSAGAGGTLLHAADASEPDPDEEAASQDQEPPHGPETGGNCLRRPGPSVVFRGADFNDHLIVDKVADADAPDSLDIGPRFTFAVWILRSGGSLPPELWESILDDGTSGSFFASYGLRLLNGTVAVDWRPPSMAHNFPGIGSNNPNDVSLYDAHIPADAWTHLAFVYDGTRATIYLNGTVKFDVELTGAKHCGAGYKSSCPANIDPPRPPGELWIAREAPNRRGPNARAFRGELADLRIYGVRALIASEVQALYQLGVATAKAVCNGDSRGAEATEPDIHAKLASAKSDVQTLMKKATVLNTAAEQGLKSLTKATGLG